jgi:hypothetical protein
MTFCGKALSLPIYDEKMEAGSDVCFNSEF